MDGVIHLWDLRMSSFPLQSLYGHSDSVTIARFSELNPSLLASGGKDKKLIVWDIMKIGEEIADEDVEAVGQESPALILNHSGHDDVVDDISWSPNL